MVKIHHALDKITRLLQPGTLPPIDVFPFLRWIPEHFLGNWATLVEETKKETHELYSELLNLVVRRREVDGSKDSYADRLLDQQEKLGLTWHELIFLAGILIEGGSDTTSAAITTFIHLMAKYPDVAKLAQSHIDAVVGEERTPVWNDFDKLPIVNAIIKETMRFRTMIPLAFPHRLSEGTWVSHCSWCHHAKSY